MSQHVFSSIGFLYQPLVLNFELNLARIVAYTRLHHMCQLHLDTTTTKIEVT